jgi:hypothetical protein
MKAERKNDDRQPAKIVGQVKFKNALGQHQEFRQGACEIDAAPSGDTWHLYVSISGGQEINYSLSRRYVQECIDAQKLVLLGKEHQAIERP